MTNQLMKMKHDHYIALFPTV